MHLIELVGLLRLLIKHFLSDHPVLRLSELLVSAARIAARHLAIELELLVLIALLEVVRHIGVLLNGKVYLLDLSVFVLRQVILDRVLHLRGKRSLEEICVLRRLLGTVIWWLRASAL